MKLMLKILGFTFVIGSLIMAYASYDQYHLQPSELIQSEGILSTSPVLSKNEFKEITGMRFLLEGEKIPISVPGKILHKADSSIFDLQIGDKVSFREKKESSRELVDHQRRIAIGLSSQTQVYYSTGQALDFFNSPRYLIFAVSFLLMAIVALFYLLKP